MDHPGRERVTQLQQAILEILRSHCGGLREFELMERLKARGVANYRQRPPGDQLSLFQSHFLLFHCLYRLRDDLRRRGEAELEIHCLNIALKPYCSADSPMPQRSDPLRDYYLDLTHLSETSAADVEALLNQFWGGFRLEAPHQALGTLGLEAPVSFDVVKSRYRRLVMAHHPDRGGDTETLQSINAAMAQLRSYYAKGVA